MIKDNPLVKDKMFRLLAENLFFYNFPGWKILGQYFELLC